ncbi:MAG: hypothetical protein WCA10_10050 [Terracidiphilus sp.]
MRPFSASGLGQSYPQHCPQYQDVNALPIDHTDGSPLGVPLTIREVARLIGCSAWTVRQRHLPQGLPCFRSGPAGKLIFYRNQVVAWILRQQKGGK